MKKSDFDNFGSPGCYIWGANFDHFWGMSFTMLWGGTVRVCRAHPLLGGGQQEGGEETKGQRAGEPYPTPGDP